MILSLPPCLLLHWYVTGPHVYSTNLVSGCTRARIQPHIRAVSPSGRAPNNRLQKYSIGGPPFLTYYLILLIPGT